MSHQYDAAAAQDVRYPSPPTGYPGHGAHPSVSPGVMHTAGAVHHAVAPYVPASATHLPSAYGPPPAHMQPAAAGSMPFGEPPPSHYGAPRAGTHHAAEGAPPSRPDPSDGEETDVEGVGSDAAGSGSIAPEKKTHWERFKEWNFPSDPKQSTKKTIMMVIHALTLGIFLGIGWIICKIADACTKRKASVLPPPTASPQRGQDRREEVESSSSHRDGLQELARSGHRVTPTPRQHHDRHAAAAGSDSDDVSSADIAAERRAAFARRRRQRQRRAARVPAAPSGGEGVAVDLVRRGAGHRHRPHPSVLPPPRASAASARDAWGWGSDSD